MKCNITRRDFKFFLLGLFAAFVFATIYDWEENVESFKKGYTEGRQAYGESIITKNVSIIR